MCFISARRGIGLTQLVAQIEAFADKAFISERLVLPLDKAALVPRLYEVVDVLKTEYGEEEIVAEIRFAAHSAQRVRSLIARMMQSQVENP